MNRFESRDREPFGPFVAISQRGMLHRAKAGPALHPRCSAGKPVRARIVTNAEAVEYATGRPGVLCRYPWCFREAVRDAGLDPEVGHVQRAIPRLTTGRAMAATRHVAEPLRPHESVEGWAWCSCGWIVVKSTDAHNPARSWWIHKPSKRAAA